jgi:hypothetical protein
VEDSIAERVSEGLVQQQHFLCPHDWHFLSTAKMEGTMLVAWIILQNLTPFLANQSRIMQTKDKDM